MAQAAARQLRQEGTYQTRTMCRLCLNRCGIVATVENGSVVRIDGDPRNPHNQGKACAKGRAGFFTLDSPHRVTRPLKRTNPEKGPGVDPGWVAISWDEALDLVADKLRELHADDGRKLWDVSFDLTCPVEMPWALAFGTLVQPFSSGVFCGNAVHPPVYLNQFAMEAVPDMPLTRYILAEGGQYGAVVHYDTMHAALELGRNREKVKVVAIDPFCGHAAGMADEWIPIRPGTDAALLLGLVNVLVNELGIYDAPFLKSLTNAPYLVGADGKYVRDPQTGKPMIWDAAVGVAKPYEALAKDAAILGSYRVGGQPVRTAFQAIADQVRKYPPEEVFRITGISAATVRRIAKEFGEAACIGSTITIDGQQLPYRPASVVWYRGLSSHKHAQMNGMAVMLLQTIIGGLDVPGGLIGHHRVAHRATEDGMLAVSNRPGPGWPTCPYPPRTVTPPHSIDLFELFPVACYSRPFAIRAILEPERYNNLSTQPEMLLQRRSNMAFTGCGKDVMAEVLRKIGFIVSISSEIEETAEFADVIIPGLHYLEDLQPLGGSAAFTGSKPDVFYGQKPVVKPPFEPPWDQLVSDGEILLELAKRAGFLPDVYAACNATWSLRADYALDTAKQYSYRELLDRYLKNTHGPDKGVDWYIDEGILVKERSLPERYPGAFPKPRVHVYHEYMINAGHQVEAVTREQGISWDSSDYVPLPEWRPCAAHEPKSAEFDFYLITAKAPYHAFTASGGNPLLREVGDRMGYDCLVMHRDAGKRKCLEDGAWVEVETDAGKKGRARVRLTTGIHPEVTLVWGSAGRWARAATQGGEPKGIHFNSMLTLDDEHMDFVTGAVDSCLRVKITKIERD
jgi:anaerobic selenocysteine-containing dehydrogenase